MTDRWVLVADSTQGRILKRDKNKHHDVLEPVEDFEHEQSREQGRDLMGNRPNQNQHNMERARKGHEPDELRDEESKRFAQELSGYLATAHAQNRFRDLVIVADPRFLGLLRGELGKPVAGCVSASIDKSAVRMKPKELVALLARS